MIFFGLWIIALIIGIVSSIFNSSSHDIVSISNNLLFYQMTITISGTGLIGFIGKVFRADKTAEKIGWPKGNPFEKELGISQLGWFFAGILSIWYQGIFWIGIIVIFSTLMLGAAALHIHDLLKNKNKKNIFVIIPDILLPLTLIVLSIYSNIWY